MTFTMLVGLPGCGKSTYSKKHYANKTDTVILSSDEIRRELKISPENKKGHAIVFTEMFGRTKAALQAGKNVVYDATNLSRKHRIAILSEIKRYSPYCECILFIEPYEVCQKRNKQRKGIAVVPDAVMDKMIKSFNVPMHCEGFDRIQLIQTEKSARTFKDLFKQAIGFEQENSHHAYDLYTHLVKTKDILSKMPDQFSADLCDAALCHDLGKLYTKSYVNAKGEETTEAHYYFHENVGAYLYLVLAYDFDKVPVSIKSMLETAALINWHMRPYLEMNSEKRQKEYDMLGSSFVDKLLLLHTADKLAH